MFPFKLAQMHLQRHVGPSCGCFRRPDHATAGRRSRSQSMLRRRDIPARLALPAGPGRGIFAGLQKPRPGQDGAAMALELSAEEIAEFEAELARLKQEHRDLDTAIEALESMVAGDQLQIQRLKKRKLILKDRISYLEDQLTPDIIA